jgi:predicted small secreted protein
MTRILKIGATLGAILLLTACETIGGLGQDISSGGEVIQDGAQQTQQEIN